MEDFYQEDTGSGLDNAHTNTDCSTCVRQGQVDCLTCINKQGDTGIAEAPVSGG